MYACTCVYYYVMRTRALNREVSLIQRVLNQEVHVGYTVNVFIQMTLMSRPKHILLHMLLMLFSPLSWADNLFIVDKMYNPSVFLMKRLHHKPILLEMNKVIS